MELHIENILSLHNEREKRRRRLEIEMEKILLSDEKKVKMRSILCQKESEYLRLKRAKMKRNMFKKIARLGVGAFGEVSLVRKRDTEAMYAMKTLRKSDVIRRNQVPFSFYNFYLSNWLWLFLSTATFADIFSFLYMFSRFDNRCIFAYFSLSNRRMPQM